MNTLLRFIPGAAPAMTQLRIWRDQLEDLRPLYPIVVPFLLWVFVRAYRNEQERLRLERVAPILRPEKRP
jgi:hypothetical protein